MPTVKQIQELYTQETESYVDKINCARKTLDKLGEWKITPNHTVIIKLN